MSLTRTLVRLVAGALLLAPAAGAQQIVSSEGTATARGAIQVAQAQEILSMEGVEIGRDAIELQDVLSPRPDRDTVDSALVITNTGSRAVHVSCTGYDRNGHTVGRIWGSVPAMGLRYALASDLSDGQDFIGSVRCWTLRPNVIGSAFMLRPLAITDLPSRQQSRQHLVAAQAVKQLSDAGELSPQPEVIDPDTGLPQPIPLRVRLIQFPVVATY